MHTYVNWWSCGRFLPIKDIWNCRLTVVFFHPPLDRAQGGPRVAFRPFSSLYSSPPLGSFQCYCYKGYGSPHLHKWFFNCRHFPTKLALQKSAFHSADHQRQTTWKRNVSFVQKPGASLTKDFYLKARSSITYTVLPLKERTCFCEYRKRRMKRSSALNVGCPLLHRAGNGSKVKQGEKLTFQFLPRDPCIVSHCVEMQWALPFLLELLISHKIDFVPGSVV